MQVRQGKGEKNNKLRLVAQDDSCDKCATKRLCITQGLDAEQLGAFDRLSRTRGPFRPGERIFRMGDSFHSIYAVQSGAVKTEAVSDDGRTQVTGFYLPGEQFGVEGIGQAAIPCDAIALKNTWVCEIAFKPLEELCGRSPLLQHHLFSVLGEKICNSEYQFMMGRNMRAERRVARFLKCLVLRIRSLEGSEVRQFHLPMSKEDIANYLGVAPETLSRTLRKLDEEGMIRNEAKGFELLDIEAVNRIAG